MRVDLEQHCSNMLYIRDAAGLTGPADYVVPPLAPGSGPGPLARVGSGLRARGS